MSYILVEAVFSATLPPIERPGAVRPSIEKLVLLRLAERANHDGGRIWQSQQAIADDCQLSERTVRAAIAQLGERGILVLIKKANPLANRAAEFRIDLENLNLLRRPERPADAIPEPHAAMASPVPEPFAGMDQEAEGIPHFCGGTIPAARAAMATVIPEPGAGIEPSIPANGSYHTGAACRSIPEPFAAKPSSTSSYKPSVVETYVAPASDVLPLIDTEQTERDRTVAEQKSKRRKSARPEVDMVAFEEFWQACPKRQAKPVALAAYAAAIERGASAGQLLIAMRRYAEHVRADRTEPKWIKTPGPWLNAERYLDEYPDETPSAGDIRAPPRQYGRPAPPSIFDAIRNAAARFEDL